MKPSGIRYFIARGWLIRLALPPVLFGPPILLGFGAFTLFWALFEPGSGLWNFVQFTFYTSITVIIGLLLGLLFGCSLAPVFLLIHRLCARGNGGPFKAGDSVHILSDGSLRRIGRVVDASDRECIVVQIHSGSGEFQNEKFSDLELFRATATESETASGVESP